VFNLIILYSNHQSCTGWTKNWTIFKRL